jgi:hypothetical protein
MAYPQIYRQFKGVLGDRPADGDFAEWTGYRVPDDRGEWHELTRQFYDYWRSAAPPEGLPGRQHLAPEQMKAWLPRLWLLDIHRGPLRFRCRLAGTELVRSLGEEVTGRWLDEVHPLSVTLPSSRGRFHMVAEMGRPTWRRGPPRWVRRPEFAITESLLLPLAADGGTVDKIIAFSIAFDATGRLI